MHQGAEDAAADAGEEEQIRREGEHHGPMARPQPRSPGTRAGRALPAQPRPAPVRRLTMFICLGRATCCGKCS